MRKLISYLNSHSHIVFRVLTYMVSVAALVLIFPREGNFPYEFQKGKPWLHNDLMMTFDFPIRKSDMEKKREKDSILKDFKPYYNEKKTVYDEQLKKFNKAFNTQWSNFAEGRMKQTLPGETVAFFKNADSLVRYRFRNYAGELLLHAYQKGIIQITEQVEQLPSKDFTLVIIRDNVGEEHEYSEVLTPKLAYEYVVNQINALKDGTKNDRLVYQSGFFKELNVNEFLLPNLIYNEEASKNVKDELIRKISFTKGMFLAGRTVIAKGEIVNEEKFNILVSLKFEYENKLGHSNKIGYIILGQVLIIGGLLLLLVVYLISFRSQVYQNNLKFTFIFLLIIILVGVSSLITKKDWVNLYVVPFSLLPIIVRTFYDARLAMFVHTVTVLIVGFMAPNGFEFVFLSFTAGAIAIVSLTSLYRRGKLFNTGVFVFLTYSILYMGLFFIQGSDLSTLSEQSFIYFAVNGFLILMAYPFIFIFERMFGFLSDITLMELSDTNQPLLRKISEKAPGTFQHSLQVANLAEEAAYKIGANPLMVRVGALYHDVGKIYNPFYFIENLSTEKNPHNEITNEESARVIIQHVAQGIEIAQKYKIPEPIIDFIRTHHGTTMVQFFYRSFKKLHPDSDIDKGKFSYAGPIPFSKEMALIMMADSVEAASRSLREVTQNSINDLVDNIIYYQMINEQYNNSDITYRDITMVKNIFKRKLMNIYHVRVEYPKNEEIEIPEV